MSPVYEIHGSRAGVGVLQNVGVLDRGIAYIAPGLLASGGIHCSQSRRSVFTQELVGLIGRALK